MDRTTLHELVSAICFLELIGDLCSLGHVFPGHKQELTLRKLPTHPKQFDRLWELPQPPDAQVTRDPDDF